MIRTAHWTSLFPYTSLFRSSSFHDLLHLCIVGHGTIHEFPPGIIRSAAGSPIPFVQIDSIVAERFYLVLDISFQAVYHGQDRKNTRLNSSHLVTSYAVYCLK